VIKEVSINSSARNEFIEITAEAEKAVSESGVMEGICVVYCPHTTAGITVNESADPDVVKDLIDFLNKQVPNGQGYAHTEGNSDAHIKSMLVGRSEIIPVKEGKLVLGSWGGLFFCEFDGPRTRKIVFTILGK